MKNWDFILYKKKICYNYFDISDLNIIKNKNNLDKVFQINDLHTTSYWES